MELTRQQQGYLGFLISDKGVTVEDLLRELFKDSTIAIIRGWDNFSGGAYTKDAYFNEQEARKVMEEIPPNGTGDLSDSYHIVTGTINDLVTGEIRDLKTRRTMDSIDRRMVYENLRDRLVKAHMGELEAKTL